jgi:hypothetical protein
MAKKIKRFDLYKESDQTRGLELHYWAFDWDDNILHMPTTILMDQKVSDKWLPVEVSTAEFAKVRNDKENYRLRNDDPTLAFSQFKDTGPRGKSAFLEDVKKALSENQTGPVWNNFKTCLADGAIFAIVTARGHEPETIKEAVEYIIDTKLSDDEKFLMYSHCLKNAYLFSDGEMDYYDRIPKGQISKTPLIQNWLSNCDFYGVSSDAFAQEFGPASASNPEKAKELALDKFLEKCNNFARKVGAKSVSIGFSDDDPKNVEHVRVFFKEKSAISSELGHLMKLNLYKTTDRTKTGGERSKFIGGEEIKMESSHQAPGLESSVVPFSKYNNTTAYNYPNTKDLPTDNQHHMLKMKTNQAISLSKEFAYNRKKKKF